MELVAPVTITLPVSEVFGPTFQGEGPHTGRPVSFLRLGLCNLSCEWCDTPYTWDTTRFDVAAECPDTDLDTILARLDALATQSTTVVVTGGEPLMHHHRLHALFSRGYDAHGLDWHVETNGTIAPPAWWVQYVEHTTVSPKINTRDPEKKRLKPKALQAWAELARAGYAAFKFVATSADDLVTIAQLAHEYSIPTSAVWVMPEGTTPDAVLQHHRTLADAILASGFNTTTRLHTLLWGDERGH